MNSRAIIRKAILRVVHDTMPHYDKYHKGKKIKVRYGKLKKASIWGLALQDAAQSILEHDTAQEGPLRGVDFTCAGHVSVNVYASASASYGFRPVLQIGDIEPKKMTFDSICAAVMKEAVRVRSKQ